MAKYRAFAGVGNFTELSFDTVVGEFDNISDAKSAALEVFVQTYQKSPSWRAIQDTGSGKRIFFLETLVAWEDLFSRT